MWPSTTGCDKDGSLVSSHDSSPPPFFSWDAFLSPPRPNPKPRGLVVTCSPSKEAREYTERVDKTLIARDLRLSLVPLFRRLELPRGVGETGIESGTDIGFRGVGLDRLSGNMERLGLPRARVFRGGDLDFLTDDRGLLAREAVAALKRAKVGEFGEIGEVSGLVDVPEDAKCD
jgi:hypothetical protein